MINHGFAYSANTPTYRGRGLGYTESIGLTLELGFDNIVLEGDSEILFKSLEMECNSGSLWPLDCKYSKFLCLSFH